jgi:hypothetical protein
VVATPIPTKSAGANHEPEAVADPVEGGLGEQSSLERLEGVGLHPVAGHGDPLDPHVWDPDAVRLGQIPAQVAVLLPLND